MVSAVTDAADLPIPAPQPQRPSRLTEECPIAPPEWPIPGRHDHTQELTPKDLVVSVADRSPRSRPGSRTPRRGAGCYARPVRPLDE